MVQTVTLTMDAGRSFSYEDALGATQTQQRMIDVIVYRPDAPGDYPVVFYSHGNHANAGTSGGLNARLLADQGYIVIVPRHLDDYTQPDVIENYFDRSNPQSTVERVLDMNFLAAQAATVLASLPTGWTGDLTTPVIAGHSQGAFTAMMLTGVASARPEFAGLANPFFEAAILISPQGVAPVDLGKAPGAVTLSDEYWTGLYYQDATHHSWLSQTVPTLTITGTDDNGDGGQSYLERKDPFDYAPAGGKYAAVIYNADHFELGGFNSLGLVPETYVNWAVRDISTTFLDAYVKGDGAALAELNDVEGYNLSHPDIREVFENAGTGHGGVAGGRGILRGDGYANTMEGSGTADVLLGLGGADVLRGGGGNDKLTGGAARDTLTGGAGDDRFVFASGDSGILASTRDRILDFDDLGDDVIDLSALTGTLAWMGTGAFTGANQVRIVASGADVLVQISTDADTAAEMVIELTGTTLASVTVSDFLL